MVYMFFFVFGCLVNKSQCSAPPQLPVLGLRLGSGPGLRRVPRETELRRGSHGRCCGRNGRQRSTDASQSEFPVNLWVPSQNHIREFPKQWSSELVK